MMQISEKHRKEYDSFGPWILEIKNNENVPDLFMEDFVYDDTIELAFIVPRNVERRNTQPGVNLYDFLVAIYANSILILQRVDEHVESRELPRSGIIAVGQLFNLLHGELLIYLLGETVIIPFNTVSETVINSAVNLLRRSRMIVPLEDVSTGVTENEEMSTLFQNLLRSAGMAESLAFLAHQKKKWVTLRQSHWYDCILKWVPRMVQESMFLAAQAELIIIQRVPHIMYYKNSSYGYTKTYIPFSNITTISSVKNQRLQGIDSLLIGIGNREFVLQVDQRFLSEAGQPLTRIIPSVGSVYASD